MNQDERDSKEAMATVRRQIGTSAGQLTMKEKLQ
jgi:hypothetical protein